MSILRLRSSRLSVQSAENFWKLGSPISHLLAFQASYRKNYSSGHQLCRTCSTTPIKYLWLCSLISILVLPCLLHFKKKVVMGGADSFLLLIASQTYYNMTMWNASNFFLFCFLVQCISNWKHFQKIKIE